MKLPVSLGIKPTLITAAVLLLVIAGMSVKLALVSAARDVAVAQLDTRTTERDSWAGKAQGCVAANGAYDAVFEKQRAEQELADARAARAAAQAATAVSAAQASAAKAQRERDAFAQRFAARPAGCQAALQALDAACPALKEY